jgi:radical SAM-linked protein
MKIRIKFQKYGIMKFIGHLDIMRYFQKAFRRANADNEYTKGFSPHQIMSFAAPLGVGLTSDGEYVDVQLLSSDAPEIMIERMNEVLTEGVRIIGWHELKDREENQKAVTAMALVTSADYLVSLKDGYQISNSIRNRQEFKEEFERFYSVAEIVIDKKTKTSEKSVDIKPMISLVAFDQNEYEEKLNELIRTNGEADHKSDRPESSADVYENGITLYLQLDTGSSANLKPELVMEAFCDYQGIPYQKFAWQVHRLEVYTRLEAGKLAALDQVER